MNFHTKNPVIGGFESRVESGNYSYVTGKTASFTGIATKTGILIAIIFAISAYIMKDVTSETSTLFPYLGLILGAGFILGFISVIIASFSRSGSPVFTVLYAISEGLVLGAFSALFEQMYEGIVFNAILITFAIFGFLLIAYSTGLFKVGFRFRKIVYTIMFGLLIYFLLSFVLRFAGINLMPMDPRFMLILTVAMVLLASFNLLMDFDDCKLAVEDGVPSRYEWVLSLGLLVSLVWLYINVLRLLFILATYFKD